MLSISPRFNKITTSENYKQNGDLTLMKENENKRSEDLRMRGRSQMNTYQGGRNRSREDNEKFIALLP